MISLAIAALLAHACSAAQLNFIDSAQQPFMRTDAASKALSGPGATAVFGALLGASVPMHQTVSNQVDAVISPDVFNRPRAILSIALAGVSEDALKTDAAHSVVRQGAIPVAFGGTASGLLQALDDVSDAALDTFVHKPLDNAGLPEYCDEACIEQSVWVRRKQVAEYLAVEAGLNYTQRKQPNVDCGPVAWCSHITPVDTPDTHLLDLLSPPDRLAAIELGQASSIVHDILARRDPRFDGLTKPVLFETTFMGPQLLRDAYGADSVQLKTLIQMATNMIADLRSKLQAAYEDRVLVQVAALGAVHSSEKPSPAKLFEWRALHRPKLQRRALLQLQADTKYRTIGLGPISVAWATDSLVWLVSITLLLAILSATLCLCRMQFANDTLLFAHAKAD